MNKLGFAVAGAMLTLSAFAADDGVTLGGYLDAGYSAYMMQTFNGANVPDQNGFLLREGGLYIGKKWGGWEAFTEVNYYTAPASTTVAGGTGNLTFSSSQFLIQQAYLAQTMENGFGWKVGAFSGLLGYYSGRSDSWAHRLTDMGAIQNYFPSSQVGLVASYSFSDMLKVSLFGADQYARSSADMDGTDGHGNAIGYSPLVATTSSSIGNLSTRNPDYGAVINADFDMFSVDLGGLFMTGSQSPDAQVLNGPASHGLGYALSAVVQSKIKMFDLGLYGMDYKDDAAGTKSDFGLGANVGYDVTEKIGLNVRGEYIAVNSGEFINPITKQWNYSSTGNENPKSILDLTAGGQYKFNDSIKGRLDYSYIKYGINGASASPVNVVQAGVVANY